MIHHMRTLLQGRSYFSYIILIFYIVYAFSFFVIYFFVVVIIQRDVGVFKKMFEL